MSVSPDHMDDVVATELSYLFSPEAVRQSSVKMYKHAMNGNTHFIVDESLLNIAAAEVINVIQDNYPDLNIPYHSRWRHFEMPGVSLLEKLKTNMSAYTRQQTAQTGVDLIVASVLLDAGAGPKWQYTDAESGVSAGRSEGLGLASLNMFLKGGFSSSLSNPLMVDTDGLRQVSADALATHFQVSADNPLVGLEGRVGLLNSLGTAMLAKPDMFPNQRPGDLVAYLEKHHGNAIKAKDVLAAVILGFGDIWPGRTVLYNQNLGDVWEYAPFIDDAGQRIDSLVSLHKLSQWLTYSIIETLQNSGFVITHLDDLTGLAEYRNGGLFVDTGVLKLRDPSKANELHKPNSELIIEWRALTIYLLDLVADIIRKELGKTSDDLPLVKILEGGTWAAGRRLAQTLRDGATAPILLDSDGTVF
jgi:uncharacterized protein (UPF0147 family)